MDESVKNALRAFARFIATENTPKPQELEGLKGFRLIEADDPFENDTTLKAFLAEENVDAERAKWIHWLLGQAETAATEGCAQIIGRIRRLAEDEKQHPLEGHDAMILVYFLGFALGITVSPNEPIEPRSVKYDTPKPAFSLGTVAPGATVVKTVGKAQPPASAAKPPKPTAPASAPAVKPAPAPAAKPAPAAAPTPAPSPAPTAVSPNRVAELEQENADLKRQLSEKDALIATIRADLARTSNERNQLALWKAGMRDRPAIADVDPHHAPAHSPPAAAHGHEAADHHGHGGHGGHDAHPPPPHDVHPPPKAAGPDPGEVRKWENHFPLLMADFHLACGHRGKDREAQDKRLREKQDTFRKRGGAASLRAVEAISAFLRGEFQKDEAGFKAKFQSLS